VASSATMDNSVDMENVLRNGGNNVRPMPSPGLVQAITSSSQRLVDQ
jgi:hypothetical protein